MCVTVNNHSLYLKVVWLLVLCNYSHDCVPAWVVGSTWWPAVCETTESHRRSIRHTVLVLKTFQLDLELGSDYRSVRDDLNLPYSDCLILLCITINKSENRCSSFPSTCWRHLHPPAYPTSNSEHECPTLQDYLKQETQNIVWLPSITALSTVR